MAGALFMFTQKVYPIAYEYKKLLLMLCACTATAIACALGSSCGPRAALGVKILLLTLYPLWMWLILRPPARQN